MLVYLSVYLLAAVMLFQGVNLLGEKANPTTVVPPEVRPAAVPASRWGVFLVTYGAALAVLAIMSHGCSWLAGVLVPLRNLGFAGVAVYGLWLVFGRKIDYTPAPPAREAHGHSH
jgi:hypothetical protein